MLKKILAPGSISQNHMTTDKKLTKCEQAKSMRKCISINANWKNGTVSPNKTN